MFTVIKLWAVVILHQALVNGHTIHLGEKCADVAPIKYFDINKFTGLWYAIEKSSTASRCIVYNITATDFRKIYNITQVSENPVIGLVKSNNYRYQGHLELYDDVQSGNMSVKYPLSLAGKASFIVFDTDYKTYAGIYSCQSVGFTHRQAAMILSRTPTLDKNIVTKLREQLAHDQVNPFDLSIISHANCNYNNNFTLEINEHTFSKDNFKRVAQSAAHAVADGVDFLYKGAKKLYYYVKKDPKDVENEKLKEIIRKKDGSQREIEPVEYDQFDVPYVQANPVNFL